jgi:hypothetical protein
MRPHPPGLADILASKTATAMPSVEILPSVALRQHFSAIDNMMRVFAIQPGDRVLFLADPLIDPRVIDAVAGIAESRGAVFQVFQAPTTQLPECPAEARPLVEWASFVVSTWFISTSNPLFQKLRREKGQRWVKVTYFRNLDLLHTPQARFPAELVGEIVRATARLYPRNCTFDMHISDPRGSDLTIAFTAEMTDNLLSMGRWEGNDCIADKPGCYVHYLPVHGPNIYGNSCFKRDRSARPKMGGVVFPQWAIGFPKPFEEKIGVEYKDGVVQAVHGRSLDAEILRDMLVGVDATLHELGCGHNPKAPRFAAYPAGSNAPGALHFGTDSNTPSAYLKRVIPHWEEPATHQDCVVFDATVKAGNNTLIDNGFLMSLRDEKVVDMASRYGDPVELLEGFVQ